MKRTQKPRRRVVSKGRYALEQVIRVGQAVSGFVAIAFGAVMGILACACIVLMVPHFRLLVRTHDVLQLTPDLGYFAMAIYLGAIMVWALRLGFTGLKEAAKSEVVPFTRANTDKISAPDSLVRASSEPIQAQESVLLRAAIEQAQEKQETRLLRASSEG